MRLLLQMGGYGRGNKKRKPNTREQGRVALRNNFFLLTPYGLGTNPLPLAASRPRVVRSCECGDGRNSGNISGAFRCFVVVPRWEFTLLPI